MAATQLAFSLRTSTNCKTVHLVGNWDNYKGQLPLSKDASKAGAWKGNFRFSASTLKQGQRYWYYYVMNGQFVSHNPAKPFVTEPTSNRKLNTLDVPKSTSEKPSLTVNTKAASRHSRRSSTDIPKGRALSPSRIVSPIPTKPSSAVADITRSLAQRSFFPEEVDESDSDSDCSDVPSLSSSRSSACSTPSTPRSEASSRSSSRSSTCSCHRFGITRKGDRVRLDCGGSRCGGSDEESDDCSDFEEVTTKTSHGSTRRQGVVIRSSGR